MNLHGIASPYVAAVNPMVDVTVRVSTGSYTTEEDGRRVPVYANTTGVPAQIQALGFTDIQKLDGLNLQGIRRKIYLNGKFDGLNRQESKGGDLIIYPDGDEWPFGTKWLVAQVLEQWPDWCCVAVTQQLDP